MKRAYFFVVLTALLFGTMEVACKIAGNNLDPFQLTFLRFIMGGLVLLPFGIKEIKDRQIKLTLKDFFILAGVGTIGIPISMTLFQLAVMSCNASTVSVLFCVNPFFTMVFAHIFTDEKLNRYKFIAIGIALLGILFLLRPWDVQAGNNIKGFIFMILAALSFGLYTIAGKQSAQRMGSEAQASISFLIGAFVLLIVMLITGKPIVTGIAENIPILLYTGIAITGLGYYTYFRAIKLADAATGSYAFFLKAGIAPVLAAIILHELLLWNTIIGILLMLMASFINIAQQKRLSKKKRIDKWKLQEVQ